MTFKHGNTEVEAEQYVPGAEIHEDFLKVLVALGNVQMHGNYTTITLPDGDRKLEPGDWIVKDDAGYHVLTSDKFEETYKLALN